MRQKRGSCRESLKETCRLLGGWHHCTGYRGKTDREYTVRMSALTDEITGICKRDISWIYLSGEERSYSRTSLGIGDPILILQLKKQKDALGYCGNLTITHLPWIASVKRYTLTIQGLFKWLYIQKDGSRLLLQTRDCCYMLCNDQSLLGRIRLTTKFVRQWRGIQTVKAHLLEEWSNRMLRNSCWKQRDYHIYA